MSLMHDVRNDKLVIGLTGPAGTLTVERLNWGDDRVRITFPEFADDRRHVILDAAHLRWIADYAADPAWNWGTAAK